MRTLRIGRVVATIGMLTLGAALFHIAFARADSLITITATGTVASENFFENTSPNTAPNLIGQPYSISTSVDAANFQPEGALGGPDNGLTGPCNPTSCLYRIGGGTATFTSGPLSISFPTLGGFSQLQSGTQPNGSAGTTFSAGNFGGQVDLTIVNQNEVIPDPTTLTTPFILNVAPSAGNAGGISDAIFSPSLAGSIFGPVSTLSITPATPPPTIVYLDFSSATAVLPSKVFNGGEATFSKSAANISSGDIPSIVSAVQAEYSAYNVQFTSTQPSSGNYLTIYVGGTNNSLTPDQQRQAGISGGTLGIAPINLNTNGLSNTLPDDSGLVFSDNTAFSADSSHQLLDQVIEHETGHLLGLFHVLPQSELMYPYAGIGSTTIGGLERIAAIASNGSVVPVPGGGLQDSKGTLLCNVGGTSGQKTCSSTVITLEDQLRIFWHDLAGSMYNTEMVFVLGDDNLPMTVDLGTISNGMTDTLDVPLVGTGYAYFLGSTTPNGPIDIYSGDLNGLPEDAATVANLAQQFIDDNGNPLTLDWEIYSLVDNNEFNQFGEVDLSAVPEPSSISIIGLPIVVFAWKNRKIVKGGHFS
jgi:hypothetical protein